MSIHTILEALKSKTRADTASWSLDKVRGMVNEAARMADEATDAEESQMRRYAASAVATVYGERFAPTIEHMSCEVLTELQVSKVDARGYYVSSADSEESSRIDRLIESRHPDVEPLDTFEDAVGIGYAEHSRRAFMAAPACAAHASAVAR